MNEQKPTYSEIRKMMEEKSNIIDFKQPVKRVVDQYSREEIGDHVSRFAQHCAAKEINPTFEVILDWLYGEKAFDERDDFVGIGKLMEMVGHGKVYPLLIMEVLSYAKGVEDAAIAVNEELGHLSENFESLEKLKGALSVRLKSDDDSKQKISSSSST